MRNSSDERLLAGPSALAWFRAALVSMIGLAIGTPGFVVFAIVERAARGTASDVTWLLAFHLSIGLLYAALLGAVLFGSLFSAKTRRELIRGYTTMPREKKAVDVVDPRTGDVLRPAMAPALATRADVRRARADIRVPWRSRERPDPERQEPVKVRTIAAPDPAPQVDPAGVTFIDVHTLYGFTNEFRDWDPTVDLHGHLVLGFDQRGVSVWNRNPYRQVSLLANRAEILGLATVTVDSGRSIAYALELTLAARVGPGRVRFYVLKDGGHGFPQDEYAVNQAIGKASRALGPLPEATTSRTVPR